MKARIILTAILFLAAVTAKAENTWSITPSTSGSETTFTISRSGDTSISETVIYRFVGLSAYAGQHFVVSKINGNPIATSQQTAALSGTFTFASSETSKSVTIKEMAAGTAAYTYQNGTTRSYKLEVTDQGGFLLKEQARNFTTGTQVPSSNAFAVKDVTINSGEVTVTAAGYAQAYHSMTVDNYFNNAAPKAYFQHVGAQLRMTLTFQCKEVDDGWQYVQIYANQSTSNVDTGADGGNPGACSYAKYVAGFEHLSSSADTEYKSYTFPVTSAENNAGATNPWGHGTGYNLHKQIFNSSRASDGRLIIPTNLTSLYVRYNASGSGGDDWVAKNTVAHIQAVDGTAPTKLAVSVAPGYHAKGNTVYVSVAFSEIVTTSNAKLTTNWGTLSYNTGSGSNVLTFKGTIQSGASGTLEITSTSGTIKDLANNNFSGSLIQSLGTTLDPSYAYSITYNLDEGSVATANPTSYTYETADITLNNPTKTTYYFDGWTGSNGNTKQTTVTIATHSHGNKSYTANWTQVWAGGGSQGDPYTITTTKGLDLLAQYVNSGNNCSGLYFQLGGNITYTHTTDWDNSASEENNYTAIGDNNHSFQGTFDGNNYTISGIRIYKDTYSHGLFGWVASYGTVKHINLSNARITGSDNVGGIAGRLNDNASIEDCTVAANVCIHTMVTSTYHHGGVIGYITSGVVLRCISSAALTVADGVTNCKKFGGIAGLNYGTITDCIADGAVVPDVKGRGAIVGYNNNGPLTRNYYRNCTVAGVANATGVGKGNSDTSTETSDVAGAKPLYAITLPANASLTRDPSATLPGSGNKTYTNGADIAGVPYATASAELSLSYNSASIPSGYALSISAKQTSSGAAVPVTDNGDYTYNLTMPAADVTVTATLLPLVSYIDADGNEQSRVCTPIVSGTTTYGNSANAEGWYCVNSDVSFTQGVDFLDQAVHIILCDGVTYSNTISNYPDALRAENGSLAIYGQSLGTGSISVSTKGWGIYAKTNIDINGGTINAIGTSYNAGIFATNGNITIRRGNVTANSKDAAINSKRSNVSILGGCVIATSQDEDGISAAGTITLGCATVADRITASSYSAGTIKVADGQKLTDGSAVYTETLTGEQKTAIAGKTLMKYLGPVSYIDEDGTEQTCTEYTILCDVTIPIDNYDTGTIGTDDQDTWYVATGNYTFNHTELDAIGHVHLILCDDATFTVAGNIYGICANSLTIYGQSAGTGSLVARTTNANIAQGAIRFSSALTINGGNVSASCAYLAGIVGETDSILTINGGNFNSTGAAGGIFTDGDVTLGWTRATDRIYASSYNCDGTISIKAGQAFSNGSEILGGVITDMSKLDGKTLVPATNAIAYIDADGSAKYCTEYKVLSDENIPINGDDEGTIGIYDQDTWYVATGNYSFNHKELDAIGHVHLILCDGATFTVIGSFYGISANSLTIYGQSAGTGSLVASTTAASGAQGAINFAGTLTINGGNVSTSSVSGGGIWDSDSNCTITINGGNVNATGALNGISSLGDITLGWTKLTDRITSSSYHCDGTISIKSGQAFSNGTEVLSGTITDMSKLDGKTLQPAPVGGEVSLSLIARGAMYYSVTHYWTTFYHANWNYRLPDGAQAFILKDDNVLYRVGDGTIVPAGCAVVIMGDAQTITLTATTDNPVGVSAGLLEANILRGVSASIDSSALVSGSRRVYVLGRSSYGNNLSFNCLQHGSTVPANKAYYVK